MLPLLPGIHFDIVQSVDANGMPSEQPYKAQRPQQQQQQLPPSGGPSAASSSSGPSPSGSDSPEVVLVVFLGGVTYAEVSALRWIEAQPASRFRFLVLTTGIINGSSMMATFLDGRVGGS